MDLEADALPIEPPRPPLGDNDMICCSTSEYVGVVWQTGSGTGLGIETFQVQNLSLAVSNLVPHLPSLRVVSSHSGETQKSGSCVLQVSMH